MSDYPRPDRQIPGSRIAYGPDRLVAFVYAGLILWDTIGHMARFFRLEGPPDGLADWLALAFEAGWLLIFIGSLVALARLRRWGFGAVLALALITVWTSGTHGNLPLLALSSFLFLYTLVRLFAIFGPRPLRRKDVLARKSGF